MAGAYIFCNGCSPCTWGLTDLSAGKTPDDEVFPMHVGINRALSIADRIRASVPHARGD